MWTKRLPLHGKVVITVTAEVSPRLRILSVLLGPRAGGQSYSISFENEDGSWRPISVIAGESQTGKTSIVEFILYCLGARTFPEHPEIAAAVRSVRLEAILGGERVYIERSATMQPSSSALIEHFESPEERLNIEPTSDPASLSQRILSAFDLAGVALPQAPTQEASDVDTLSIRDVLRIVWLPNDRLDSKNLVFEHANYNVTRKFKQTIDAIFGVDDAAGAALAANLRLARQDLRQAEAFAQSIRNVVGNEYPDSPLALEVSAEENATRLGDLRAQLHTLDNQVQRHGVAVTRLKARLDAARVDASRASLKVRNRRSLLSRLVALRAQYIDDHKKLSFLFEADRLFDPLQVTTCPACFTELDSPPGVVAGNCTLCGNRVTLGEDESAVSNSTQVELRALKRRLSELEAYIARLEADLNRLEEEESAAGSRYRDVAASVDSTSELPAPFLALRDDLQKEISDLLGSQRQIETGLRLWQSVIDADATVSDLRDRVARLREERSRTETKRVDRSAVIGAFSGRFGQVLAEMGYPKLSDPYIDENLVPHVRGLPYSAASSGGQVLISLAWYLSLWEVSYEMDARAPGLLIIDSPQKNLGHRASDEDSDFSDSSLVANFYTHVKRWLNGPGSGAQLIVVDNTPPSSVEEDVVVRFTRDPSVPPYGLIHDATD